MHLKKTGHVFNTQNNTLTRSKSQTPGVRKIVKSKAPRKCKPSKKTTKDDFRTLPDDETKGLFISSGDGSDIQGDSLLQLVAKFQQQSSIRLPLSQDTDLRGEIPRTMIDIGAQNTGILPINNFLFECTQRQQPALELISRCLLPNNNAPDLSFRTIFPNDSLPTSAGRTSGSIEYVSNFTRENNTSNPRREYPSPQPVLTVTKIKMPVEIKFEPEIDDLVTNSTKNQAIMEQKNKDEDALLHRYNKKRRQPTAIEVFCEISQPPELILLRPAEVSTEVNECSGPENIQFPLDLSKKSGLNDEVTNAPRPLISCVHGSVSVQESLAINDALLRRDLIEKWRDVAWNAIESTDAPKMTNYYVRDEIPLSSVESPANEYLRHDFANGKLESYKSPVSEIQRDQSLGEHSHRNQYFPQTGQEEPQLDRQMYANPPQELERDQSSFPESRVANSQMVTNQNTIDSYECPHCGIIFTDYFLYSFHMSFHSRDDPFRCKKCCAETGNNREFFMHIGRVAHSG